MESKQCLDIEQMQHLKELGVDTSKASMCWIIDEENKHKPFVLLSIDASDHVDFTTYSLPTFTLQDILDLLPKEMRDKDDDKFLLKVEYAILRKVWYIGYYYYDVAFNDNGSCSGENLIDAAYSMLCWCVENGYIETKKQN